VIGQEEVSTDKSVYQISSTVPNRYAAYFKSADQSFRIYCDGDFAGVQVGNDAYFKTDAPKSLQAIVTELPVPLGPYPEPIMALTLASVDTKASLMTDMQSVEVVDREPYNQTPAMHLRGLQIDGVKWDLWIATEKGKIQPLRMLIDLSNVLTSGDNTELPEGFRYEIDMLFTLWKMSGNYDKKLFTYSPPAGVQEYESLEDYYESLAAVPQAHALVGQMALDFEAEILPVVTEADQEKTGSADSKADSDSETTTKATEREVIQLSERKGKIVVLDFWATWCGPCIAAMPVIDGITKKYADKGVEFYALNIGESTEDVQTFFKTAKVRPNVLLDPQSVVADAYKAEAIPQTVVIGKDGRIEAVHVGYSSLEELEQLLTQQLEVLVNDGSLLTELPK
jgi:thiol-disulfide isomerase/thioredoxin